VLAIVPKKLKILLAEDEPSMRRYIQMIMSRWDCELAVEPTGADAIRRAATFKPDVALLGLTPPQWSGQKRPTVVRSKPANGCGPGLESFNPASLDPASLFLFSSSVVRISGRDRGVAVGRAWR
jgi:CheY-like chemotaxis protein